MFGTIRRAFLRPHGADYCPLCDAPVGTFEPFGVVPRTRARCPRCGALERDRAMWVYLTRHTDLLSPGTRHTVLHFAPERPIEARLAALPHLDYVRADLGPSRAAVRMDVTAIPCPDRSFDVVLASHVLEHVADDRRAMGELIRVLKPTGWVLVVVPLHDGPTDEDPTVTDPDTRTRRFGQHDHVRVYGPDVADRLKQAGFEVARTTGADLADAEEARRMGLRRNDVLFVCRRAG